MGKFFRGECCAQHYLEYKAQSEVKSAALPFLICCHDTLLQMQSLTQQTYWELVSFVQCDAGRQTRGLAACVLLVVLMSVTCQDQGRRGRSEVVLLHVLRRRPSTTKGHARSSLHAF